MARDKELRIKIVGDSKSAEQALDAVAGKGRSMGTALKVGIAAAAAGVAAFGYELKRAVDAAAEEEKAIAMLADSMRQHGTYSDEALKSLTDFASAQQKLTTFADEATVAALHQLQTYGMNTEQMKAATKAAQDLAAAKGIDLTTAANLVGRAFSGNTAMLSRYGIVLDDARLQAEGFSYVLEALNGQFGGAAAAAADTYTGRMQQMKNAFGDLQETIGYAVLPSLKGMVESLSGVFADLQESGVLEQIFTPLADAFAKLAPLLGDALTSVLGALTDSGILDSLVNIFVTALQSIMPIIEQLAPPIMQIGAFLANAISSIVSALAPAIQALAPILASIAERFGAFLERASPVIAEIANKLGEILTRILEKMEPYIDQILDAVFEIVEALLPILPTLLDLLDPILQVVLDLLPPFLTLIEYASKIAEVISGALGRALEWLAGVVQNLGSVWSIVWSGIKSVFEATWNGIIWFKDNVIVPVVNFLGSIWDGLAGLWNSAFDTLKKILKPTVIGFLEVAKAFATAYDYTLNFGEDTAPKVEAAISKVRSWHKGGPISKDLGEILLPMGLFQGGEWVIQESAVRALGERNMALINQGRLPSGGGSGGINIYVDTLYGSKEYVRLLAQEIVREMPAIQFGAWARV